MRVLWDAGRPLTAAEVAQQLEGKLHWKSRTVRSFLTRLVTKMAVESKKMAVGGLQLYHYRPLICPVKSLQTEQECFLDRFFGGTVYSMLASCIQKGQLTQEEMRQLRELLDKEISHNT